VRMWKGGYRRAGESYSGWNSTLGKSSLAYPLGAMRRQTRWWAGR
jgi:hypothetical protein